RELGWLRDERLPRMIAVQSDGCGPIVRALEAGQRFAEPWASPRTRAWGIRVPAAVGGFMIIDAGCASGGCGVMVPEGAIAATMAEATGLEGISFCPEAAACVVAARQLVRDGRLRPDERVVIFNTASGLKYHDASGPSLPRLPGSGPVDYA